MRRTSTQPTAPAMLVRQCHQRRTWQIGWQGQQGRGHCHECIAGGTVGPPCHTRLHYIHAERQLCSSSMGRGARQINHAVRRCRCPPPPSCLLLLLSSLLGDASTVEQARPPVRRLAQMACRRRHCRCCRCHPCGFGGGRCQDEGTFPWVASNAVLTRTATRSVLAEAPVDERGARRVPFDDRRRRRSGLSPSREHFLL